MKSCAVPLAGVTVAPSVSVSSGASAVSLLSLSVRMVNVITESVEATCCIVSALLKNSVSALSACTLTAVMSHSAFGASSSMHDVIMHDASMLSAAVIMFTGFIFCNNVNSLCVIN